MAGGGILIAAEVISSLATVYSMVKSFSQHGLTMPKITPFKIPQVEMAKLNTQIAQNTQLSSQARQVAQTAMANYSAGKLSPAYAGEFESQMTDMKKKVEERLASQGFTADSTQWQSAMQNLSTYSANLKSHMLQSQLQSGLSTAGFSTEGITALENKWRTQAGINTENANTALKQTQLELMNHQIQSQKNQQIGEGFGNLVNTIGKLAGGTSSGGAIVPGDTSYGGTSGNLLTDPNAVDNAFPPLSQGEKTL